VIGAGAFGAWTSHHLANAGARVTLVDAYGPGHSRSSSGDESRILRCGYGRDEIYSRFARRSRELWRELEARHHDSGLPLWHQCGMLWTSTTEDPYLAQTVATLEAGKYGVERLDRSALRSRYPQLEPIRRARLVSTRLEVGLDTQTFGVRRDAHADVTPVSAGEPDAHASTILARTAKGPAAGSYAHTASRARSPTVSTTGGDVGLIMPLAYRARMNL